MSGLSVLRQGEKSQQAAPITDYCLHICEYVLYNDLILTGTFYDIYLYIYFFFYCVLVYRKAVRHTVLMTSFGVTTTSASL